MSLTQEQKAIADEVWIKYRSTDAHISEMFDEFLSRIREEQKPYGWIDDFGNFENSLKQWMVDEPNVTWSPLFTIPPASDPKEHDCKELVEALEKIRSHDTRDGIDAALMRNIASEALAKHKASMGEKE